MPWTTCGTCWGRCATTRAPRRSARPWTTCRHCPSPIRLAVHRIVQEALTNARKHAPGERVDLTITVRRSHSRGCPPRPTLPGTPRGYGLVGVGERVAALHGERTTGRGDDGRFVLRAQLPVPPHHSTEGVRRMAGAVR
ncbi:sensor histidine kinase [Streptomyces niveus]|uniref:sensor histidine kinase n=1 Tax=Streptomyces niveus TaxID=193462 RepID=UPI0036585638